MLTRLRRTLLPFALTAVVGCADAARHPVSTPDMPRTTTTTASDVWRIEDVNAFLSEGFSSLDTTQVGNTARLYVAPDATTAPPTICRDHFKPIDLWWDGGNGIATFHLDPPLLFVGYRPGTVASGVLRLRRAIYETSRPSEATDPAGNVWRFHGRFNALCAFGELDIGPIIVGGQILRSQDPIDRPVLVRRGDTDDGGCGSGGGTHMELTDYDPYDPDIHMGESGGGCAGEGEGGSGIQYQPGDSTGGETVNWETGVGNGGYSVCGDQARVEYVCIDVWVDGVGWVEWSCGYATTC